MSTKRWLGIAILALVLVWTAACSPTSAQTGPTEGARVTGATLNEESAGSTTPLSVHVTQANEPIGIDFRGALVQGSFRIELLTPEGAVLWDSTFADTGSFAVNTVVEPAEPGDYPLTLSWDGPVQATYNLRWQPGEIQVPTVSPYILLSGIGMILVAVGYVIYAAVRRLSWAYLGLGAGAWIATVVIKFVWAVPANPPIYAALTGALPETPALLAFAIYVGSLTGFTEVLLTWLLLRYTKLGHVPWGRALAFGIGFGAVEALLLGANSVIGVVTAIVSPSSVSLEALEQIARQTTALYIATPVWERFFTVLIHIFANICLFYGVVRGRARWLWVSFVFKSAIDAVAAWAQFGLLATVGGLLIVEGIVAAFGIAGWLGTRWIGAHYPEVDTEKAGSPGK
jgi:uncharacterized membrane protein YhfC